MTKYQKKYISYFLVYLTYRKVFLTFLVFLSEILSRKVNISFFINRTKHKLCNPISQKLNKSKIKQKIIQIELDELYSKICSLYTLGVYLII